MQYECPDCGLRLSSPYPPERIHHPCPKRRLLRVETPSRGTVIKLTDENVQALVDEYRRDCKSRKVSRDIFRQRAGKCDVCECRRGLKCAHEVFEGDFPLLAMLPWPTLQCPAGEWHNELNRKAGSTQPAIR